MVTGYATSNSCRTLIVINIMHSNLGEQLWEIRKDHLSKFPFSNMLPKEYVYLANMIFNTISKSIHCNIKLLEIDRGNDTLWLLEDTDRRNRKNINCIHHNQTYLKNFTTYFLQKH